MNELTLVFKIKPSESQQALMRLWRGRLPKNPLGAAVVRSSCVRFKHGITYLRYGAGCRFEYSLDGARIFTDLFGYIPVENGKAFPLSFKPTVMSLVETNLGWLVVFSEAPRYNFNLADLLETPLAEFVPA